MIAVAEAFVLAERLGLSHQALFDVAANSSGQCWALSTYCPVPGPVPASPANHGYRPGFAAALMLKDLSLGQEAAAAVGADTALGRHARDIYRAFVENGGGLLMVGGYFSFQGIDAKANYRATPLADALPVEMQVGDDRVETPEDPTPRVVARHPVVDGLPEEWPALLGYQRFGARGDVLATVNGDPLLVVGEAGEGRTLAYASDIGPHWAPPAFLAWDGFARLWNQAVRWLAGR
jgi:hypothetical protein